MPKSNDPCRTPTHRSIARASSLNAGDDSPTLSQEPVKVTWKWNSENTPIRSSTSTSKLKLDRLARKSPMNSNLYRASITSSASKKKNSSEATATVQTNSPKGLFKFQEEMRKIQLETEQCDNVEMQSSPNEERPMNVDSTTIHDEGNRMDVGVASTSTANDDTLSDSFKRDLLNDSDFDQMLLTCTETVERKLSQEPTTTGVAAQSKDTAETSNNATVAASQSNYMSLLNDESIDDMLGNIDDSFIMNSINVNNSKMLRHKSMPQDMLQSQAPQCQPQRPPQQPKPAPQNPNRRSFARHESMPVPVTSTSGGQTSMPNSK